MDSHTEDIHNIYYDKIPVDLIIEINYEKVFELIKKRQIFNKYKEILSCNVS